MIDLGLGIVIPLHCHLGFESIITDYVPKRKFKFAYYVLSASLAATTIAALYGCYQFNTNDVGITELSRRIWRNKTSHSL